MEQSRDFYFLKGNNPKTLNARQQLSIIQKLKNDSLDQAVLIYDPVQVKIKVEAWKKSLPWIQPYFAMKASPSSKLINYCYKQGFGIDCASKKEIQQCLNLGVSVQRIIYSNTIKIPSELHWATSKGIKLTTADCIQELYKIKKLAPNMDILWRIAVKQMESDQLSSPFSKKFGDDLQTDDQIHERMVQILRLDVNLKGIHFHAGSGKYGSTGFSRGIQLARRCIKIGKSVGHRMHILDVGGGFPMNEIPESLVEQLKPTENDQLGYKVIAQPGRYLSDTSHLLACKIIGSRIKSKNKCIFINESIYHCFSCINTDNITFDNDDSQFYSWVSKGKVQSINQLQNCILFGMTCDGGDLIFKNFRIPVGIKVGDILIFGGMGAYTYSIKNQFNGMVSSNKTFVLGESIQQNSNNQQSQQIQQSLQE